MSGLINFGIAIWLTVETHGSDWEESWSPKRGTEVMGFWLALHVAGFAIDTLSVSQQHHKS